MPNLGNNLGAKRTFSIGSFEFAAVRLKIATRCFSLPHPYFPSPRGRSSVARIQL